MDVKSLVRSARVARLATASPDGRPHVVPICFAYDGTFFYSVVDRKPKRVPPDELVRVRNIRANPQVCLLIDHYEEDWSRLCYVLIPAEAEVVTAGEDHRRAIALLRSKYSQYEAMDLGESLIIKIRPRRMIYWSMT
ncbi:MAG TPA: TIGR03668 family PPOX class F420-dependent oxidoreductase [Blastocatellia bacterium]|nr:TIGR03668 family PPOX class F420-dependent oxidoreductase [Blastocatellia bacterium]